MATIKDIAKEAGVAPSVVSRALNNKYGVKESTKELIQKIAQRMDYHPNAAARSLVTRKTDTIGIMMADLSEPYYSQIIKGMEYVASLEGYTLLFSNSYESVEHNRVMQKMVLAGRVDGLVIVGSNIQEKHFPLILLGQEIPFTLIERNLPDPRINCIWLDNVYGAYLVVKYLVEKGHRKIAHITGNTNYQVALDRIEGYQNALKEVGIPFSEELMVPGNFISQGGYEAMKELLRRRPRCTAVFAASDSMAYAALQAISEAGLKVPDDIAVVGFDDLEFSGFTNPPLTTIRQPRYEMGQKSMEVLVEILRGDEENGQKICLTPELVIRKSV
ncbi:MAG TPA: LacI family DNA-binding transcriptional regulator [Bacillota bacterium]|nr:LacI family DNA-binding transcriptional regulator [Bacillota bacterium]